MATDAERPWNSNTGSTFWKNITSIAPAFQCSTRYRIGNGKNTAFWQDSWLGTPLKFRFPNLYRAVQHKNASVSQHYNEEGWFLQLPSLTTVAQNEKDELLLHLQQFQLAHSQDEMIWLRGTKSVFSVSSMYSFLAQTPSHDTDIKNIWQIKAPLRVLVFGWLLLTNRLTTIDNLSRRGWYLPNMCTMCKSNGESVQHLFQNCPLAKEVRRLLHATFAVNHPVPAKFLSSYSTQLLTDPHENSIARQWEITTCFVLWRERCRRIFSDTSKNQIALLREIRNEYGCWFKQLTDARFYGLTS